MDGILIIHLKQSSWLREKSRQYWKHDALGKIIINREYILTSKYWIDWILSERVSNQNKPMQLHRSTASLPIVYLSESHWLDHRGALSPPVLEQPSGDPSCRVTSETPPPAPSHPFYIGWLHALPCSTEGRTLKTKPKSPQRSFRSRYFSLTQIGRRVTINKNVST